MTTSGIEPATFRFVTQCLNELRHRELPAVRGVVNNQCHIPVAFPQAKTPAINCTESWVGPEDPLNRSGEDKIFYPKGVQTPNRPGRSESADVLHVDGQRMGGGRG